MKLDETYKHWKDSRDELDMYERDPRRWLRQHGRFRGLGEHMTLADKVMNFGEDVGVGLRTVLPFVSAAAGITLLLVSPHLPGGH